MVSAVEHLNVCHQCGGTFINFCVSCEKQRREEVVEELMEKYSLTLDNLIADLASQIKEGNFPALKLAIELRSMKPPQRTDITSGGNPIRMDDETRNRILEKLDGARRIGDSGSSRSTG
jgi:hypothetical protein